jgi:3-methyl-2-oxobutanoate hydroxymethyltransferase
VSVAPKSDTSSQTPHERVTAASLREKKARGEPLVMLTAYDFGSAQVAERAGVDIILVGDSGAMTVLGYPSTRDVSVDEMLVLVGAVRRGATRPMIVGDLPYGSYEAADALALQTARRFMNAGCDAVKIEGGGPIADRARALVGAGIPVVGHVGLTPQTLEYKVQGRSVERALEIAREAEALEDAGCFLIVFEAIPAAVASLLTARLTIPVIGIGAGEGVDGQVLVYHDLLGLYDERLPRFVKRYAELKPEMIAAVSRWADDVRARRYPEPKHTYAIDEAELMKVEAALKERPR